MAQDRLPTPVAELYIFFKQESEPSRPSFGF